MAKLLALACLRNKGWHDLSPRPHYPSMPRYPNGGAAASAENSEATALFSVIGMTCSACAGSVEKAIKRLHGIREAIVDVLNNRARVLFYPSFVNEEDIREAIEDAGFEAALLTDSTNENSVQVCRIQIKGMTCTSCSTAVESALKSIPGVVEAQVALATEEAQVQYNPNIVSHNQILEGVKDAGFEATVISSSEDLSKIDLLLEGDLNDHSLKLVVDSLRELPGVLELHTLLEFNKISISYKPDVTGPRNFINLIEEKSSGNLKAKLFPGEGGRRDAHRTEEIKNYYRSFLWSLVFTVPVFLTSMVFMYIPGIKDVFDTKILLPKQSCCW